VMEWRGAPEGANPVTIPPELQGDGLGKRGDAGAVAESVVALLECAGDRGEHASTDSAPGRGLLPRPDAAYRPGGAGEPEPRQSPSVLDRPQEPVVVSRLRELGTAPHGRPQRQRFDPASATRIARPLVED